MGFEQKSKKKLFKFNLQNHPFDKPILNFPKHRNLQCEPLGIWMNAGNEDEVSESFLFAFHF